MMPQIEPQARVSQRVAAEAPTIPLRDGQSVDGVKLRYAVVQDVEIPQGLVEEAMGFDAPRPGLTRRRRMDMLAETWISVVVDGVALAPGEGSLYLGISPPENPAGQTAWTLQVDIARK